MSEKVIYELRLIETEDGLRIEMKGDKERMRDFARGHGMRGFGRHDGWKKWAQHGRHFGWAAAVAQRISPESPVPGR